MSIGSIIFLDTCILESEQFDFGSPQIRALFAATKGSRQTLLLPHPTALEIDRHIESKINAAISAVKVARKTNPFLARLPGFPRNREDLEEARRMLTRKIDKAWRSFKKKFEVVELDYTNINLHEIMDWYDREQAPFGKGEKRKEFPDALAFAALRNYARKKKLNVAVVSSDNDFRDACVAVPELHHFPSLPSLITALLKEEMRFEAAGALAKNAIPLLAERIIADFPDRGFGHEIDPDGHSHVEDVIAKEVEIDPDRIAVIGLGHDAFTISFTARVEFSAWAKHVDADTWVSLGDGDYMYTERCEGTVTDETKLNCVARIATDSNWENNKALTSLHIKQEYIEVRAQAPTIRDDYEE